MCLFEKKLTVFKMNKEKQNWVKGKVKEASWNRINTKVTKKWLVYEEILCKHLKSILWNVKETDILGLPNCKKRPYSIWMSMIITYKLVVLYIINFQTTSSLMFFILTEFWYWITLTPRKF